MTVATGRRSRKRAISKATLDEARTLLQELPEKPKGNVSLREAVGQLRDQIEAALAKGYSYNDLVVTLSQQGIDISPAMLRRYIPTGRTRSSKASTKASPGKTRETKSQDTAVETAAPVKSTRGRKREK